MISDEKLLSLQTVIVNWIKHKGCIDFSRSRKTVENAGLSLSVDMAELTRAEYKVIYPLYQAGILECGKTPKGIRLFPCASEVFAPDARWHYSPEFEQPRYRKEAAKGTSPALAGEGFLDALPALKECALAWRKQQVSNLKFRYDLAKYTFRPSSNLSKTGIYKQRDEAWADAYFRIEGADYLIPSQKENPEALRIARSCARAANGIRLFEYSGQRLKCIHYGDIPVPVIRGLLISAPDNLANGALYRGGRIMEFDGIPRGVVRQLERIFSAKIL